VSDWRRLPAEAWRRRLADAGVDTRLVEPFALYLQLLARWEGAVDLVGRVDADILLREHLLESLAGAAYAGERGALIDVGSGNGFPAIPLLLARPGLCGVMLEPRERRWVFLREVVRELRLDAEVRRERIDRHRGGGYDVMSVRALGADVWAGEAARLLGAEGTLLWWTTAAAASALAVAGMSRVITSSLPAPKRGVIAVWRRCFT
jgi:16S rRNA (guanine(527)-N(7))-methyltransferase RsmG